MASLATMTHSRPDTLPMPVMIPAPGDSSSYMPVAASGDSSRNGDPGSTRVSTRSLGNSFPRATWRARELSGPPSEALARERDAAEGRLAAALQAQEAARRTMEAAQRTADERLLHAQSKVRVCLR